jgi:hypothetical protein
VSRRHAGRPQSRINPASPKTHISQALLTCYPLPEELARQQPGEERGMEALLNNLTATVIAGVVLTIILAIVIHVMA